MSKSFSDAPNNILTLTQVTGMNSIMYAHAHDELHASVTCNYSNNSVKVLHYNYTRIIAGVPQAVSLENA